MSDRQTNFEKISATPAALAEFLDGLNVVDAPWEKTFQVLFCSDCKYEDCPTICPFERRIDDPSKQMENDRPMLWLHMLAEEEHA